MNLDALSEYCCLRGQDFYIWMHPIRLNTLRRVGLKGRCFASGCILSGHSLWKERGLCIWLRLFKVRLAEGEGFMDLVASNQRKSAEGERLCIWMQPFRVNSAKLARLMHLDASYQNGQGFGSSVHPIRVKWAMRGRAYAMTEFK